VLQFTAKQKLRLPSMPMLLCIDFLTNAGVALLPAAEYIRANAAIFFRE
jgi:hypothetical protein